MRTLKYIDKKSGISTIVSYNVPDVGDKIHGKKGFVGFCTGIVQGAEILYEISNDWQYPTSTAMITDIHFKDGELTVVSQEFQDGSKTCN